MIGMSKNALFCSPGFPPWRRRVAVRRTVSWRWSEHLVASKVVHLARFRDRGSRWLGSTPPPRMRRRRSVPASPTCWWP